jgi:hypothetical protein
MLKKVVLVALFVVSAAAATAGTVFAHSAQRAPLPTTPQGFPCPAGIC